MNQRYYSLDVFRGATVALMILVNNPGSWTYAYAPLKHAPWNGCTPTDLVFPFFLFAVGNALAFVMPRFEAAGTKAFLKKVIKRFVIIFLIGLFLNWTPFLMWNNNELVWKGWTWANTDGSMSGIRTLGVLQRVAICYFAAAMIIYFFKARWAFVISAAILLIYWFVCWWLGTLGDPYSLAGYFGTNIDISIVGINHIYKGEGVPFDPEGLASVIPAITQVIFGYFVGKYIQDKGKTFEMLANLLIVGVIMVAAGYCWDMVFPINKKIWSSSYVLFTTGLGILTIGTMIFLIEFKSVKGGLSKFFDVFGKNPLFVFALSSFLPRVLGLIRFVDDTDADGNLIYTTPLPWFYNHICKPLSTDLNLGSFIYAILIVTFFWSIAYVLDKKKIYIKV